MIPHKEHILHALGILIADVIPYGIAVRTRRIGGNHPAPQPLQTFPRTERSQRLAIQNRGIRHGDDQVVILPGCVSLPSGTGRRKITLHKPRIIIAQPGFQKPVVGFRLTNRVASAIHTFHEIHPYRKVFHH